MALNRGIKMKKIVISLLGGLMLLAGLVFVVIPGPALIFIVPGLILLSIEYSWAESCRSCSRQSTLEA